MISYVKGTIMYKTGTSVMLSLGSWGCEILLPLNRLGEYALNQEREFYVYHYVREDQTALYGFQSWQEREFFLLLLNVSGVGPKGALAIIGQSTADSIYRAIMEENIDYLTKMPGVGKKTAQRLILELKDKLPKGDYSFAAEPELSLSGSAADDMVQALLGLGYHEGEIRRILPQIKDELANDDEQGAIKKALRLLMRS